MKSPSFEHPPYRALLDEFGPNDIGDDHGDEQGARSGDFPAGQNNTEQVLARAGIRRAYVGHAREREAEDNPRPSREKQEHMRARNWDVAISQL